MSSQRIDPKTDGRPDPRPTVRENVSILGDLTQDFDFNQAPRQPLILNPTPGPGLIQQIKNFFKRILQSIHVIPS